MKTGTSLLQPQAAIVIADTFSNKAADLICRELGFETSVDWVDFLDEEAFFYMRVYQPSSSYLLISDLHCEDEVMKFDDCSYNIKRVITGELIPYIILSCNPKPG